MPPTQSTSFRQILGRSLSGSHMLAFIPLVTLGAYWAGGEAAMAGAAVIFPLVLALFGRVGQETVLAWSEVDALTGLVMRDGLIGWADAALPVAARSGRQVAVIAINIDELDQIEERFGRGMRDKVVCEARDRLKQFLREDDTMARLSPGFAIGFAHVRSPETENLLQMARRLQSVFDEPFSEGPTRTYCSLSIGIAAQCHVKGDLGANLVAGAQRACELATMSGPGSVRVYSEGLSSMQAHDRDVARELSNALETGEIFAWFQPQLRTETGEVTGFEALARWEHPERGMISPNSFLPDIEKSGLSQRLAEVILKQSLTALNAWDAAGFHVPTVSVNFSTEELRNPRLPDYVRWELDRHDLEPRRLVVEVLESVVAESSEDVISRTLTSLSGIGCMIDLDDFGTGFTSFINIRRFKVSRIKIDRSLVTHCDRDDVQRRMLAALLAFARKLEIDVLAEGVETEAEVETLIGLGIEDMQGYVAARPMPLGETLLWLEEQAPPEAAEIVPLRDTSRRSRIP